MPGGADQPAGRLPLPTSFVIDLTIIDPCCRRCWNGGAITTLIKVTNLFNQSIQQHIFGDILRRTVTGEVRFSM